MRYICFFTLLFIVFNTEAQTTGQPKADASIPEHVQKWLAAKTAIKKGKATQKGFFRTDSIRIVGYVKGYSKSANYASGIIYHANNLTREDFPITVRIYEDGRLECSLLAVHPISSYILINDHMIQFYAEPGTTLGIVFDYKTTEYMGINKDINDQLAALEMARADYDHLTEYRKPRNQMTLNKCSFETGSEPGETPTVSCG